MRALDGVSLSFAPGEIHALVGENGAGKSTLMKIICGIYRPDAGQVRLDGRPLHFRSYHDSLRAGIDIVYQEIQVVPENTVAESIMLDKLPTHGWTGVIDWKRVNASALRFMRLVQLDVAPGTPMKHLSAAQKRLVQIARALSADARVILLDEPTSTLTEHEAENLFGILRRLKEQGVTLVFVSHKFEEVFAVCDRASVLRDGRLVDTRPMGQWTRPEMIQSMIGREFIEEHLGRVHADRSRVVLKAEGVTQRGRIHDASFELHEGEILGFYGLVGSGRTELARSLIGDQPMDAGKLWIEGRPAAVRSVGHSLYRHRLGYVTDNRKEDGLFLDDTVRRNITVTVWPQLLNRLTRWISGRREDAIAADMIRGMSIRTPGGAAVVEHLSGGNQQKVSVAKWLAADCRILIFDEPTVGVDVAAKGQIHQLIRDLAETQRKAIILISSDMPEIIKLANRILVFRDGRIVGEVDDVDNPEKGYDQLSMAIGNFMQ